MTRRAKRPGLGHRFIRFVRALFSSGPSQDELDDGPTGGLGVREPRKPVHPSRSGSVALEAPPAETKDVWAVGDESRD